MSTLRLIIFPCILFLYLNCNSKKEKPLFELINDSGIEFANNIEASKDFNVFSYRNFYNGGGVAIADVNNDGLADVFMTANMGPNKLYLNKGGMKFEDVSEKAGFGKKDEWSTGVAIVDINADGWLDIYVCNAGYIDQRAPENKLYINNKNGTFTDKTSDYVLSNRGGYCTHAAFFDYDIDGDLDVFIINNSFIPVNTLDYKNKRNVRASDWPVKDFLKGGGDKLLRNDNGRFVDVSKEAGIYGSLISFGLGVTVGDVNGDHYPDVYVSNDFFERDYLYINQKNGTFSEELEKWTQHISLSSMGADIADINNDDYPDIFTTDMLPGDEYRLKTTASFENIDIYRLKLNSGFYNQYMQNTLQVNNRNGKFMETAYFSGVAATDWSWGALIFDSDNDGLSDIYVCNGIYNDVTDQDFIDFFADEALQRMVLTGKKEEVDVMINKMPSNPILNKFYLNKGNLKFSDAGESSGFTQKSFSNGAAYGDLDNDGDLDLIVNNVNEKAFVYRNNSSELNKNNFIGFKLKGNGANQFAVGAKVKLFYIDTVISRELIPSRGFQSSVDYKILMGLGNHGSPKFATITWPDLSVTSLDSPEINKVHEISQDESTGSQSVTAAVSATFLSISDSSAFTRHHEDDYVDFYAERNIPMIVSKEGPKAAVGDVNGDKLDDVFICGTSLEPGQLYIQTANEQFVSKGRIELSNTAYEDVCALFFDSDKDGDLDLFVGSGGNNRPKGSREYYNRIYHNDGKGNFTYDELALPPNGNNCAVAINYDFDNDGDDDLFVGSRSVPQDYGSIPESYMLVNDGGGKFSVFQKDLFAQLGLITGAVWADINHDNKKELIVAGEWMGIRALKFDGKEFKDVETGLEEMYGWWHSIYSADLDGDGNEDLVLGNVGENNYLRPGDKTPLKIWINDFDDNGTVDKIFTRSVDGKDVPVFMKRELTDQIPSLKKQNLKHHDYATKSIQDLFPSAKLEKAKVREINYAATSFAFGSREGKFRLSPFQGLVQLSCVNAIAFIDVNNDGKKDLVMGGNEFGFLPQFSRLDASFGHVLLNVGKGSFYWAEPKLSGFQLSGEIRDIKPIGNNRILVLQNNEKPVIFKINKL